MRHVLCGCALAALLCPWIAWAQPPAEKRDGILVDSKGMALYTFDEDSAGVSRCYAQCAKLWPPLHASDDAVAHGNYTLVKRRDGRRQWAFKGKPLYYWLADTKPGQATGEAVAGWHLVR